MVVARKEGHGGEGGSRLNDGAPSNGDLYSDIHSGLGRPGSPSCIFFLLIAFTYLGIRSVCVNHVLQ